MSESILKTDTFLLIQDTHIYTIRDGDLRFTLANLALEERRKIRDYVRRNPGLDRFACFHLTSTSKFSIKGFRIALYAVQLGRDLRREMEKEVKCRTRLNS